MWLICSCQTLLPCLFIGLVSVTALYVYNSGSLLPTRSINLLGSICQSVALACNPPISRRGALAPHPQPMERRSESETHPPPAIGPRRWSDGAAAMLPRPHHPAMGRGRPVGHNMAPVPRRYPTMGPRGREQRSKSRLGPCPPPMGRSPGSQCWRIDVDGWRMQPPDAIPTCLKIPELSADIVNSIGELLVVRRDPSHHPS